MKTPKALLPAILISLLLFFAPEAMAEGAGDASSVWLEIDPIQCMGNPWEAGWLEENSGVRDEYPTDDQEQDKLIRAYYEGEGVKVRDLKRTYFTETIGEVTLCLACSCPAGYTLKLLVPGVEIKRMQGLGFKETQGETLSP